MEPVTELWQLGAVELAERIRSREVSSREVLEAHLARVDAVNGDLNAIVRVLADEAREAAARADEAVAAGEPLGPLHGVPCSVKENIDVAGTPTTQGVRALAEAVATTDAPVVARVRAAGAIPFARTNLPDLALRVHTDSDLHGLTRNPWRPDVTAGGSSGGEGSAIASGMSPMGLGNDVGGSLRNPAHCCGIASLKPSVGVVPGATEIPPIDPPLAFQLMNVQGPMARRVADVRAALEVVRGPDPRDPTSLPVTLTDAAPDERLRVAVMAEVPGGDTDPGVAAAIRDVAARLDDAGHDVVEAVPPGVEEVGDLWEQLLLADLRVQKELLVQIMGADGVSIIEWFDADRPASLLPDVQLLHPERFRLQREWTAFYRVHPILLAPVWARTAFPHGADLDLGETDFLEWVRPVLPANLLGTPSAVTPAGVVDGLPVGVQVMGDRFTDLRCLTVAAEIESLVGTLTPIDPVIA
jgi:amidase